MPPVLYTADVICPMSGPPLADGGVLVEAGAILAVGPAVALRPDAARTHHTAGVLLPGLVNAHTHLELTDAAAVPVDTWDDERWSRSAHRGVTEMLRSGATVVGDVVTRGPAVPAAARAELAGDSWVAVDGVDATDHDGVLAAVERALDLPSGRRRVGIAPISPTAVGTGVLQALAALAERRAAPLHLHLGESAGEVAALLSGHGPVADRARAYGLEFEWLDGGTGLRPVAYADACGVLGPRSSLVHGLWVDAEEAGLLAARGTTVVCCPRAGDPPLEHYADAGTALAIGTESALGSPDRDLLEEAAAWVDVAHRRGLATWPAGDGPRSLTEQAVRLLTVDGAAAMGWHGGVLEPGRRADLVGVAVEATPGTVYDDLLDKGRGHQVLTLVAGVARARRDDPAADWPPLDPDTWRG
jgi:aminodeoxyfutalosine deaminase